MPGKIIKLVKKPCLCEGKPSPSDYGQGTQWRCDDCGAIYELQCGDSREPNGYWSQLPKTPPAIDYSRTDLHSR